MFFTFLTFSSDSSAIFVNIHADGSRVGTVFSGVYVSVGLFACLLVFPQDI